MILDYLSYFKMKKILLKNFRNERVYIETKGIINTRFYINKSIILINRHKLVIANEEADCTILLDYIKKVKFYETSVIKLIGVNEEYIIEI